MGWYCYFEETLHLPFPVECIAERSISPLRVGDEIEIVSRTAAAGETADWRRRSSRSDGEPADPFRQSDGCVGGSGDLPEGLPGPVFRS